MFNSAEANKSDDNGKASGNEGSFEMDVKLTADTEGEYRDELIEKLAEYETLLKDDNDSGNALFLKPIALSKELVQQVWKSKHQS